MTYATLRRGKEAEISAADFLTRKGWKIIGRNFRARSAELDLIALDAAVLVFVEVKQRSTRAAGLPEDAIDVRKITKLYEAANVFLKRNAQHAHRDCRFDVIAIDGEGPTAQLRHITNALCR